MAETTQGAVVYGVGGYANGLAVEYALPALANPMVHAVAVGYDSIHGGAGAITGTVEEKAAPNVPLRRKVRLHRDVDGMLVRETWSNATTGAYTFTDISLAYTYTVIAYDYALNYRAVGANAITPEVAP